MSKINKYIFIITLLISISVLVLNFAVKADSGFDSSWDSGGGGGGSWGSGGGSWDDDYDYSPSWDDDDSRSGSSNLGLIEAFGFIGIFICWHSVFIYLDKYLHKKKIKYADFYFIGGLILTIFIGLFLVRKAPLIIGSVGMIIQVWAFISGINNSKIEALPVEEIKKELGNEFDLKKFLETAFKIYYDVQIAWMDNDIERVRNILDDNMFNTYKMQLKTLEIKNQKNVMEKIKLKRVFISNIKKKNNKELITVVMIVTCKDYLINIKNNKVLRGSKKTKWRYEYSLSYLRTVGNNDVTKCPNCDATLGDGRSVKCNYCGTIINRETDKFVLIDKKMINQRKV